jgi:hypothetical protein
MPPYLPPYSLEGPVAAPKAEPKTVAPKAYGFIAPAGVLDKSPEPPKEVFKPAPFTKLDTA